MGVSTVDLIGKIKTVDWIVALDSGLVRAAGGASSLTLPPDWYVRQPLGEGGLIVQAGAAPQSGISAGPGKPPLPPPAYVLLNAALRPIVADKMDIIQSGTLDSTAPLLNTTIASEAWLRRFDVLPDEVNDYWRDLRDPDGQRRQSRRRREPPSHPESDEASQRCRSTERVRLRRQRAHLTATVE
jgi:hypothetical protein